MPLPSHADLSALIRHRRSIKPADLDPTRPVEQALLVQILEDATWAPNHGLTEPWLFHIFQGDSRLELAANLQQAYRESTPPAEFREDKLHKMAGNLSQAPVVIAAVMRRHGGGGKIPAVEEVEALACALQNLQLSATAAGLGGYWSSPPALDAPCFKAWLDLKDADLCVGLIYLGWPRNGLPWPRSVRRPLSEKTVWHG